VTVTDVGGNSLFGTLVRPDGQPAEAMLATAGA
jgi:hypothetical protein